MYLKTSLKWIILTACWIVLFSGCAVYHRYGQYYGRVVDAETMKPLEGAAVVAAYYTQLYTPAGAISKYLETQETLTDRNGEFTLPALNALTFRPLQSFEPYARVTIFKPGHGCYPTWKGIMPIFFPNWSLPAGKYVTVKLPGIEKEPSSIKLANSDCRPSPLVPESTYPRLKLLIKDEEKALGIQPNK